MHELHTALTNYPWAEVQQCKINLSFMTAVQHWPIASGFYLFGGGGGGGCFCLFWPLDQNCEKGGESGFRVGEAEAREASNCEPLLQCCCCCCESFF